MNPLLRRTAWAVAALAILAGAVVLVHHQQAEAAAAKASNESEAPDPYTVNGEVIEVSTDAANAAGIQTSKVEPRTVPQTLTLSGRTDLDSERVTHVHAQFPGKVVRVGPQLGDRVQGPEDGRTPATLCVIESTDLAQAKSDWLQAKVQLKLDEENLGRTRELLKSKVLAEKFLLDAEAAVTKSRAVLDAARQKLLVFGLNDKDLEQISGQQGRQRMLYEITSPRSGVVVEKGVVGGELADPTLNLFTVADTSRLWIWGDVYERDRHLVKDGQKMKVILTSQPDHPLECTVEWVSPVLDANTRSIKIRGALDNSDGGLLAQMYATLVVTVADGRNSVVLPSDAVVREGARAYVFVQEPAQNGKLRFRRQAVKVEPLDAGPGLEDAPRAEASGTQGGRIAGQPPVELRVSQGVTPGQTIVQSGALGLFNEMEQHNGG